MDHLGITAVAIVFWIFVGVVSVGGMVLEYRKQKLALEPLRMAIEHGQQLSPEVIDRLLGRDEHHGEMDPRDLQIGGIITCASGAGLALLSGLAALMLPPHPWLIASLLGVGVLAVCVGVGLLIAAKSLRR
jgi:hypothetical protein